MTTLPVHELATRSAFIFRATVQRLNASTLTAISATENEAVVRVDEVFDAPAVLGDLTGKEITIQLAAPAPAGTSKQAIFYARPWLYGESIAVQEVGRTEIGPRVTKANIADTRREFMAMIEEQSDQPLKARLSEAGAVVVGRVVNTRPATAPSPRVTEHDPGWQEAVIAVESVEMGDSSGQTVDVLFAGSMDVMWFRAPKLQVGREGIWLLRRGGPSGVTAAAWTCLDPLDELPKEQLSRVRELIATVRQSNQ